MLIYVGYIRTMWDHTSPIITNFVQLGQFRHNWEHRGTPRTILNQSKLKWIKQDQPGQSRTKESKQDQSTYIGPHWTIQDHNGPCVTAFDHRGSRMNIYLWDHGNISE